MAWFIKNVAGIRTLSVLATGAGTAAWWHLSEKKVDCNGNSGKEQGTLELNKVLASYTTNFTPSIKWDSNWDRRDPKSIVKPPKDGKDDNDYQNQLKKITPTASRHLFLIRHGQYVLSGKGDENRMLTELGKQQADITGKRLKELNHNYDVLVNSTMTRAKETAEIIAKHLSKDISRKSCDLLREGAPYPPEPPVGDWKPEAYQFFEDGARIEAAFRKYFHRADCEQLKDSHEVVVFHANVIRYFVCRSLQIPPEAWLRLSLHNSSITWVTIRPSGRVSIRSVGDAGHLPPDSLTFN